MAGQATGQSAEQTTAGFGPVRRFVSDGVMELVIDAPPVNALGHGLRAGLWAGIEAAEADPAVGAVVIRAEGRTFPAGADISEFGKPPRDPILTDLCNRIETCSKPVVAAIHGTALGGGLEVALAAHVRIARADARLGLPEVTLGILPGAGGTQRLPRLVGAEHALRLMLGGRPIPAAEALVLGMLDEVVDDGLDTAARALAARLVGRQLPMTRDRRDGMRDLAGWQAAVAAARARLRGGRLPAPERIVDCVEAALLLPFEQGLAYERAAFLDLVASPEAAALRHAFFAERTAARFPEAKAAARPLGVIGVFGGAAADAALTVLQAGLPVVLVEASRPALIAALERIAETQERAVQAGKLDPVAREADWARLSPAIGAAALAEADLVLVAEAEGLAEAADATRPGTVLAVMAPGALPPGPRPADTVGLHLVGARLAELVVGPETAPEAVATAQALARKLGRAVLREAEPGGVAERVLAAAHAAVARLVALGHEAAAVGAALHDFGLEGMTPPNSPPAAAPPTSQQAQANVLRVLSAMVNEGARILAQGIVPRPSDIDFALIAGLGFPRWQGGPMHWADERGLLILRRDLMQWAEDVPALWSPAPLIEQLVSEGRRFADLNG